MRIPVNFFNEEHPFRLRKKQLIKSWIDRVVHDENGETGEINIIFTSDSHLLKINQEHLNHDYFTDIITFNYNEDNIVSGDLFISVDRVKDNAKALQLPFIEEMHRVIIHGVLHLLGYHDKKPEEISVMRQKENFYLEKLRKIL